MLIDVLLVVGDNGLGDGLTDGVDLGGVTTTGDTDTNVDTGELVNADDQEGLVDLDFKQSVLRTGLKIPRCHLLVCGRFVANPFFPSGGWVLTERVCVP